MRIVIEIDGTPVVATDVSRDVAPGGQGALGEPPPDVAETARALGALSAGRARFIGGADFATAGAFESDIPFSAAADADADTDAGAAADAAARPAAAPRRVIGTTRKTRRTKRG